MILLMAPDRRYPIMPLRQLRSVSLRLCRANSIRRHLMQWTKPQACDFRFGFEITMYIATR